MKINIGIDLNKGFCEVVIEGGPSVAFNNVGEVELKQAALKTIELVTGAEEMSENAAGQIVVDGKIVTTRPCEVEGCSGTVMHLEKRSICNKCGKEYPKEEKR